jgi:hypothetical protein
MSVSPLAVINIGVKFVLLALIAFYLLNPDLPQFQAKVMPLRSALFPVAAMLIPAVWLLRGRPRPYPHLIDTLVVTATVVDYGGNAADWYRFWWFDHTVHFTNMVILTTAFGLLLANTGWPRLALAGLALGFGSVLHTIWEITEFTIAWFYATDLHVDNLTTIRDFGAGLVGSTLGATLVYLFFWNRVDLGGRLVTRPAEPPEDRMAEPATRSATSARR